MYSYLLLLVQTTLRGCSLLANSKDLEISKTISRNAQAPLVVLDSTPSLTHTHTHTHKHLFGRGGFSQNFGYIFWGYEKIEVMGGEV